jgi:peptide/nickel transport system permease protein
VARRPSPLVTLWVVTVLVFVGTEILPGDVAEAILGQSATPEAVAAIREQLNLDRPAVVRYADWLGNLLQGDLGISLAANIPISEMISGRLKNTLILAALTAAFAVPLSLALGLAAAMFPGGRVDRFVTISTLFLLSVPEFFIAAALVLIFAVQLQWLPAITSATEYDSVWQLVKSLALPILTLTTSVVAHMARMTRAAIINIVLRHALLNAVGPVVNVVALNLAYLIGGVTIVETVFSYPGLARLMVDAVSRRDMPLVQACAIIFCSAYIFLILIADLLAIFANPRLRHAK